MSNKQIKAIKFLAEPKHESAKYFLYGNEYALCYKSRSHCLKNLDLQSLEKITVVVCDHQARDLLTCVDRAIVLSNGKVIASGGPNEIIKDTTARSAYFGDEFKIN